MDSVLANANSFTITTVHGKKPETVQFNAFDKQHQAVWVDIFKEGLAAYNNPDDHDSWETGSTTSDFQDPIEIQTDERLTPVLEENEEFEYKQGEDSFPYAHLKEEGISHLFDDMVGGNIYKKGKSTTEPWKIRYMTVDIGSGQVSFFPEKTEDMETHDLSKQRGQINFRGEEYTHTYTNTSVHMFLLHSFLLYINSISFCTVA